MQAAERYWLLHIPGLEGVEEPDEQVKEMTLTVLSYFDRGVSVSELLSVRECRTLLINAYGKVPSRRCLSMRMLRYCRQSYLKRRFVRGEYRYEITEKGLFYMPREPLWRQVEDIFFRVRKDPRYKSLIPNKKKDRALQNLFIKYAKEF